MIEKVFIYGLFDLSGWCHYVGQTVNPYARSRRHLDCDTARFKDSGYSFKIIRSVECCNANRVERQIGLAYQRRGQAELSKTFIKSAIRENWAAKLIYIEGYALPFPSPRAAANAVGCSVNTIANNVGGSVLDGDGYFLLVSEEPLGLNYQI